MRLEDLTSGKIQRANTKLSYEIAYHVYKKNCPIDYEWLNYLKRTSTKKELLEWAKGNIESFVDIPITKKMITMAAKELLNILF